MKTHLTWGEEVREHATFLDKNGALTHITFASYRTLCKRLSDEAELPPDPAPDVRPEGLCKTCWGTYMKQLSSEELPT